MHCTPALAIRERYPFRKSNIKENSLVVQCLGLGTFNFHCTGSGVQPLVRELRSHKMHSLAERKKERKKSKPPTEALAKFTLQALTTVIRQSV